jgi:sodium/proline symporter
MDAGKTGRAFFFGVMLGGLSWGFGYLGQPHLLSRYMAIQRPREVRRGMLIAMIWVLLAYWGAPLVGIVGRAHFGSGLSNPEEVMPLLARTLLPGWIAGIMISGAIAAMMSTADSQLIVVTSTLVEDIYVKLVKPDVPPRRLVLMSRIATVAVSLVALFLAFVTRDLVYNIVSYAWAGLGASFGPPLLLALRWRRTTKAGVLAGMLGGMTATILWKNVEALQAALDIKIASFLVSLVLTLTVSLWSRPRTESTRPSL